MDTLTHALSGALIARATAPRKVSARSLPTGRRMLVGAAAAAFPDLDFVTSYMTPLSYLYHHRGITHSLLLWPLWAALIAFIFAAIWRFRPGWRAYFGIAAIGVVAHIAGDLITSFGTMIFAPVSDARYALSATFIIDLWFTGIILTGLFAAWVWRRSRIPSVAASLVLVGYVGFQWVMQQQAIAFGREHASRIGIQARTVTAMPRPVSPFNWTIVVEDGEQYRYAHVNLVRKSVLPQPDADTGFIARLNAPYRPVTEAQWIAASRYGNTPDERSLALDAYTQPNFRFFRWFAAYPSLLKIEVGNPSACVWFHDLRFITPGRAATPFHYGMCRGNGGEWQAFQRVGDYHRAVY
jgi:inner membrane protein